MHKLLGCLFVLAACGGGDDGGGDDGPGMIDAPTASAMITISGTASSRGLGGTTPEAGVVVAAYASSDEATPLAMSTTDASGNYTMTITTNGTAIDGFLKATKSGFVDSYLYPPGPIVADLAMVPMNMLTTSNYGTLYAVAQTSQTAGLGTLGALVVSAAALTSPPVMGATIQTSPASAAYRYSGSNGLPTATASTAADGIGFAFNVPVGALTVSASKSGSTFKTTSLKIHADAITQTIIIPQ